MGKINTIDRYTDGGYEPRLNPKIVEVGLNAKLGPGFPVNNEPAKFRRKNAIGLPSGKFETKKD